MQPRAIPACRLWAVVFVVATALLPGSAVAQAGLSGDPLSGQAEEMRSGSGQFDQNFQSKSALGQLEEMTGTTVDRSTSNQDTAPRVAPRPAVVHPRVDTNQMIKQELAGALAGALVGALFSNLLDDNSAQQRAAAEAAAAEAAAQAEAFRVQQELARQARIRQAMHYRVEWDSREADITNRLGGAFDVGTGTAFFGRPAAPDSDVAAILSQVVDAPAAAVGEAPDAGDSDPSVVDLRDSSLVVQPSGPGVIKTFIPARSSGSLMPRWAYDWDEPPPPRRRGSRWQGLVGQYLPAVGEYIEDYELEVLKDATIGRLKKMIPGNKVWDELSSLNEKRESRTKELWDPFARIVEHAEEGMSTGVRFLGSGSTGGGEFAEEYFNGISPLGRDAQKTAGKMAWGDAKERLKLGEKDEAEDEEPGDRNGSEGDVRPLNDVGAHPDLNRLLYGSGG